MKAGNDNGWRAGAGGLQLAAVLRGLVVGLITALAGGVVLGILTLQVLAVETHLQSIASAWCIVVVFAGALAAGRRAGAKGWLNGGATGVTMALIAAGLGAIALRSGISWLSLGRNLAIGLLCGAIAGTIGVNLD